ncbi:meprin A subunit beta [Platysternon megacephalum]|uniref:Meprin A subunit beta n=1 Tax=Platysternon megacephalum TaxID=55544 RepID=A0A4D9DUS7_9SAUR|nr:meprin A subunit beta [Platysternon megacephalum]
MLDHEYTTKEIFQNNFFQDWRKEMTSEERKKIKHLEKCDFKEMHKYFVDKNEARKALPKEEKQKLYSLLGIVTGLRIETSLLKIASDCFIITGSWELPST